MMAARRLAWSDEEIDRFLAGLLRVGVVVAAIVVGIGAILYLSKYGMQEPRLGVFHGEPGDLTSVSGIVLAALARRSQGLIQVGLLLLIATPIARVAFSFLAFIWQRDWLYVGVTALVLSLLLMSLFGAPF